MPTEDFKRNIEMDFFFFFMNNTNFIENQNKEKLPLGQMAK